MPRHQIRFYGPFNLHALLEGVKKFLDDRQYEFKETFKMKKGGEGWKFETDWEGNLKVTHFVKKDIAIYFLIMEIKDVEVVVDGKKQKLQHGRGIIDIDGNIEFGWQQFWPEWFTRFFLTYFYKEKFWGKWVDGHWYEVQDLAALIRQLLNFEVK